MCDEREAKGKGASSLPKGADKDKLRRSLELPLPDDLVVQAEVVADAIPDTEADTHSRTLRAAELEFDFRVANIRSRFGRIKADFASVPDGPHAVLSNFDPKAEALKDRVMQPLRDLEEELGRLDSAHAKSAKAEKVEEAKGIRDDISALGDRIAKAISRGEGELLSFDSALGTVEEMGAAALDVYRKAQEEAKAEWSKLNPKVAATLGRLVDCGSAPAAALMPDYKNAVTRSGTDYVVALAELKQVKGNSDAAERDHKAAMDKEKEAKTAELKALRDKMKMPSNWDKMKGVISEALGGQDVRKMFAEPMDMAEKLLKQADSAAAMAAALEMAAEAAATFADYAASKQEIEDMSFNRSEIIRVLDFYKADRPKDHKEMQGQLDELEKGWSKMKPSVAAKGYADLYDVVGVKPSRSWKNFRGRCEIETNWKSDFKRRADQVEDDLKKLDASIKAAQGEDGKEGYQGQARATLRSLLASTEGEISDERIMPALEKRLRDLQVLVAGYTKVPTKELRPGANTTSAEAAALVSDQATGQAERKRYLDRFEHLRKIHTEAVEGHKAFAKEKYSEDEKQEYDEIKKLINRAASTAKGKKAESDFQGLESAIVMVERAKDRLFKLGKAGTSIDRGKLELIQTDWETAHANFILELNALVAAVSKETNAEPRPDDAGENVKTYRGADAVVAAAAGIARDYMKNIDFKAEARDLVLEGSDNAKARKRARESAIAKVRDVAGFLVGNPATRLMMKNLFNQPVGHSLNRTLRRIELEVLRGV
ncbi:hypothetical protein [Sedimentitalea sp.]|uniref:hypothetical protein n=1 Tax=Sedimentitalea sp. TaxID=2048915 RepID=UPI003298C1EE